MAKDTQEKLEQVYDHGDTGFDAAQDALVEPPISKAAVAAEKPTAPTAPSAPTHPSSIVRQALRLGATKEQINAATLDEVCEFIDIESEKLSREREQNARARAVDDYMTQQRTRTSPAPEEEEDLSIPDEDAQLLSPGISKLLKKIPDLAKENKALKKTIADIQQGEVSRRQQAMFDAYDAAFDAIGDARYGDGAGLEMTAGGDEIKLRDMVIRAAGIDLSKDTPAVVTRKIVATHKALYGAAKKAEPEEPNEPEQPGYTPLLRRGSIPTQPNGKPRISEDEYDAAATQKPTSRGRKEPRSRARAIRAVAQEMTQNRLTDEDFFEEDGLPD